MKNIFFLLFALTMVSFSACGDDDGGPGLTPRGLSCTSEAFSNALSDAVMNLSTATNNYVNDQSPANCEAYRLAANEYLDAVEDFEGCAGIDRQTFQQSLEEARQSVMDIQC